MSKNELVTDRIDLGQIESAARNEPMAEIPSRPPVTRIIASRPTDVEIAADFKARISSSLHDLANIKEEMKTAGGFDFNFSWGVDAFGRTAPGPIVVFKIIP